MNEFVVIGGGIAGASAGYFLAQHGRVTVLEGEPIPGIHATGRSAAWFSEYYGGPEVRALTAASRDFYETPPPGFGDAPLLSPRGALVLVPPGADEEFDQALAEGAVEVSTAESQAMCPVLRPGYHDRALLRPRACDLDVAAAHQGFLAGIRRRGGRVVTGAHVRAIERVPGGWRVETAADDFTAPYVVNAAGAWADEVADLAGVAPIGLRSLRRTAALVPAPAGHDAAAVASWPMVTDVAGTFYAKPESGGLLLSPADATPMPPGDPRPDDLDVALAIARFEEATTIKVTRVTHRWAGLRSSVAHDVPVIGEAPDDPGFFWLAALSGYGIQVAPAAGQLLSALVTGAPPRELAACVPALVPASPVRTS
ncbi:NAD(P)/FAD-dependent oxidoreductase [Nonomuraea sediminis]|uniref:NAD(P)/FAD-dependent oxidoreductase n=1 Tax=Nonomuraea sediminis TaxID=2835864 RepID=UPI001BDC1CBE|nr:FAD-binding oxidoreductase [Nonomuraea sediminis]